MQNISPIKQRILQFIDTLGISKRDFYSKTGISRGTLESKTGITEETVAKFIASFPEISPEWLLTGKGIQRTEVYYPQDMKDDLGDTNVCENCKMKDELIDSLKDQVQTLKKLVRNLEKDKMPE